MQKVSKNILFLTSLETGGAAQCTFERHQRMLDMGYNSYVAVRGQKCLYPDGSWHAIKQSKHLWNRFRRFVFRSIIKRTKIDKQYSVFNLCERFTCHSAKDTLAALPVTPDEVYVHWVSDYVNAKFLGELKQLSGANIYLVMIDHALYSGGCHYPGLCDGYQHSCTNCPISDSKIIKWAVKKNMKFKAKYLPHDCIIQVGSGEEVIKLSKSTLYKDFSVIKRFAIVDENKYCPTDDKTALRKKWELPVDKKIVLFGCQSLDEPRKGMKVLWDALDLVKNPDVCYVAAGRSVLPQKWDSIRKVGFLNEAQLIEMYQLSDVFVCPSLADAGPMMVNQSIMCGTPVVAFPVGVSMDIVKTGETGYLAMYDDAVDLAKGIDDVVGLGESEYDNLSKHCRQFALNTYALHKKQKIES